MQNYAYARTHVGKGDKEKFQKANGFTNQIKKYLKLFEWAKIENADLEYNYNDLVILKPEKAKKQILLLRIELGDYP